MTQTDTRTLVTEPLISFSEAARLFPTGRRARPVAASTVWRWATTGVRTKDGRTVRLETLRLGSRWITTTPAVQRFLLAQQPGPAGAGDGLPSAAPNS